ncbi:hypothetical protein CCX46_21150 [Pseudomonas sp. RU47]|nr:hypothetical protein CCX46_21150 [Pseudomonas sp. RU47]
MTIRATVVIIPEAPERYTHGLNIDSLAPLPVSGHRHDTPGDKRSLAPNKRASDIDRLLEEVTTMSAKNQAGSLLQNTGVPAS